MKKPIFFRPSVLSLCITGIMIAMEVVLQRFVGISSNIIQLHLGFLPIGIVAMLYGPLYASFAFATADILGMLIFPTGGGGWYFGFTLTAILTGLLFGLFLYPSDKRPFLASLFAALTVNIFLTLGLDSYWLHLYWGNGFAALLPARLLKIAVMIPLQTVLLYGSKMLLLRSGILARYGMRKR